MLFIEALLENPLLLSSLFAAIAASIVSGIVGSYVVVKRIVFISGSIAHSVLAGLGASLWISRVQGITWISPLMGALISAILSALIIGWIHLRFKEREDTVIAMLWSIGMAIGIIFISLTPGYTVELTNFLTGNILWTDPKDLYLLAATDLLVIVTVVILYNRFLAVCFDEKQAALQGQPVEILYLLLLVLTAIAVVLLIHTVGVILVIAMLTIPPALANLFVPRLSLMMILATALNIFFCTTGIAVAFYMDLPTGATITLLSGTFYLLGLLCR